MPQLWIWDFDRAFLTIIDTHVTTIVSAIFLFLFGTGPVRGFAVTLVIGLIANVFTSIYVSRAIFDFHLSRMEPSGGAEHLRPRQDSGTNAGWTVSN